VFGRAWYARVVVASLEEVLSRSQFSGCSPSLSGCGLNNAPLFESARPEKVDPLEAGCVLVVKPRSQRLRPIRLSRSAAVRFRKIANLKASQDAPAQFFDKLVGRESKAYRAWRKPGLAQAELIGVVRDRNMKDRQ